jgi:hypothetical protein
MANRAPHEVRARNVSSAIVNGIAPGAIGIVDARLIDKRPDLLERHVPAGRCLCPACGQERSEATCGARRRDGSTCAREPVHGAARCLQHGGRSTGARTAEGRARVRAAQKRRWDRFRAERAAKETARG